MMSTNASGNAPVTIAKQLQSINLQSFSNELERKLALREARALLLRLETPFETAWRFTWVEPSVVAMFRTGIRMGLFERWVAQGGKAMKPEAIERLIEVDPVLLGRLLRHLAANAILEYLPSGEYALTPFSSALADKGFTRNIDESFGWHAETYSKLPRFLTEHKFQNPIDPVNSNWKAVTGMPIMETVRTNPDAAATIASAMALSNALRGSLAKIYPTESLFANSESDSKILVDVGGNIGHDSLTFLAKHPEAKGKIVLQDLPETFAGIVSLDEGIEKMPHDFFTPQPVQGAAAYYLHSVLHDWPDVQAQTILENLRPALKKGHSKLLIHDIVVEVDNPQPEHTTSDITMMNIASAYERTLPFGSSKPRTRADLTLGTDQAWKDLLASAGFVIRDIHRNPLYYDSVIEAELA